MDAHSGATGSSVTWLDYGTFAVYVLITLAVGIWVGGRQKNLQTYLLAGHRMHWAVIAISVLAALFSGISFLGAPAESYQNNLIYLWVLVAYFIATPITTLLFLPFFFRLNFYTAYEYLEHRFNLCLRQISSAVFIVRVTLWLALLLSAPALVIAETTGIPLWISILLTGICTTIYTTVGGMRAVIYTDVMQFCVLVLGIAVVFMVAVQKIPGGFEGAWQIAGAGGRTTFFDWHFSLEARMTIWSALIGGTFLNLVQLATDQVSVQRYLTATSLRESQRALWFKLAVMLPLVSVFFLTGVVLYSFYQTHPGLPADLKADRILPYFVAHEIASPVPGLLVAAILSATMSAASSGINSLTTATLIDFVFVRRKGSADEKEEARRVRMARLWTVAYGVLATLLAFVVSHLGTLVEASVKIAGLFGGPLLGVFFLGILSRRANASGALVGVIVGTLALLALWLSTDVSFMWFAFVGCVVTYVAGEVASRFSDAPAPTQAAFSLFGPRP